MTTDKQSEGAHKPDDSPPTNEELRQLAIKYEQQRERRQAVSTAFVQLARSMFKHLGDWVLFTIWFANAVVLTTLGAGFLRSLINASGTIDILVFFAIWIPIFVATGFLMFKFFSPNMSAHKEAIEDFWDAFWDALDNR